MELLAGLSFSLLRSVRPALVRRRHGRGVASTIVRDAHSPTIAANGDSDLDRQRSVQAAIGQTIIPAQARLSCLDMGSAERPMSSDL